MGRRDFIVLWLEAFFLALFPWLRNERGLEVLDRAIESAVPKVLALDGTVVTQTIDGDIFKSGSFKLTLGIKGFEVSDEFMTKIGAGLREEIAISPDEFQVDRLGS